MACGKRKNSARNFAGAPASRKKPTGGTIELILYVLLPRRNGRRDCRVCTLDKNDTNQVTFGESYVDIDKSLKIVSRIDDALKVFYEEFFA